MYLLTPIKITCDKLVGGAPGDQNRDIHLTFSGSRLQHGYRHYVTITKPRSASLHLAIIMYVSLVGYKFYSMMGKKDVCTPCYFLVRYERYTCKECEVYIT